MVIKILMQAPAKQSTRSADVGNKIFVFDHTLHFESGGAGDRVTLIGVAVGESPKCMLATFALKFSSDLCTQSPFPMRS